jgi:hypothetical protein
MVNRYTGRNWRLDIPPHVKLLTANEALTVREEIRRKGELRDLGYYLALSRRIPKLQFAHVVYYVLATDDRTRDPANWQPSVKKLVDGMVKAGVLPDDDHKHLLGPDPRLIAGSSRKGLVIVISEMTYMPDPGLGA